MMPSQKILKASKFWKVQGYYTGTGAQAILKSLLHDSYSLLVTRIPSVVREVDSTVFDKSQQTTQVNVTKLMSDTGGWLFHQLISFK